GAHEAGEDDDPAQGRAAPPAARRLVEARESFVTELGGQDLALRGREGEERGPGSLDVTGGERAVERGEARAISIARHGRRLLPVRDGCQSWIRFMANGRGCSPVRNRRFHPARAAAAAIIESRASRF